MKSLFLTCLFVTLNLFAHDVPHSAVAEGSGGAGVASVEVGDASFMNPANLRHIKERNFYFTSQKDLFGLSLTENDRGSIVPGALSYFSDKDLQMFSLGLADFVLTNLSFGVAFTYWQAEFDKPSKRKSTVNMNAGFTWTPTEHLGLAIAFENMLDAPDTFTERGRLKPNTRYGLNYLLGEWFRWRFDLVTFKNNDWTNWTPETGFETFFGQWFIVRAGYSKPPAPHLKETYTAGFGFDLPRFRLDYASKWHANGGTEQRHYVDFVAPF